jgi:hypothetical protein
MQPHPMVATPRPRQIAVAATVFVVLAILLTVGIAAVIRMSSGPAAKPAGGSVLSQVRDDARAVAPVLPPEQAPAVADEVDQLRNSAPVEPRIPSGRNRIAGEASLQPDLYAAAFVKALLTQNYVTPRDYLLGWVQAESAATTEPRVVGLIPPKLRPKWAVFSVTSDGPTSPVPTLADWTSLGLRQGRTTVEIQRVIEPVPWSTAVAAGEISDPGVTAREVTALVTLHTTEAGIEQQTVTSVALTLNLEGPPARPTWGFVGSVTYDAVLVGRP